MAYLRTTCHDAGHYIYMDPDGGLHWISPEWFVLKQGCAVDRQIAEKMHEALSDFLAGRLQK